VKLDIRYGNKLQKSNLILAGAPNLRLIMRKAWLQLRLPTA
jgi:hypothetical protein